MSSKKLEDYSKDELLSYIKSLKKQKKFGLVWEDKPEQVAIDCETNLPVLEEVAERAIEKSPDTPTNLIIEGDNYHSLSTLNYTHAGKVDVIYIDPPYNTGGKDFMYNDNYVDTEDKFRHSKWLSFMNKRLSLAKHLLAETGIIFISIDDNEQANLRLLCDQVFGEGNFVGRLTWESTTQPTNVGGAKFGLQKKTEQILCFAKNKKYLPPFLLKTIDGENRYPHAGKNGPCRFEIIEKSDAGSYSRQTMKYEILGQKPRPGKRWQIGEKTAQELLEKGRLEIVDGIVKKVVYPEDELDKVSHKPFWAHLSAKEVGTAQSAKGELNSILGYAVGFDTVKPVMLISEIISHIKKDAIVLDFFAGSGTTGHSVLSLNKEDGGSRSFILCTNNENDIARNITYQRIKKVINGYADTEGSPANVRYFKTDFVSRQKTDDQTRLAIVDRCTDMIRIRENTFKEVINDPDFKLYKDSNHYTAIIFDSLKIPEFIKKIEEIDTSKPVSLYNFSYSSYAYDDDIPETTLDYTTCSIPESVLEVYQRIFRKDSLNV